MLETMSVAIDFDFCQCRIRQNADIHKVKLTINFCVFIHFL